MMIKAMLIAYAEIGVHIDKCRNTDAGVVLLFSVPQNSYHKDAKNIEMSGKHLASRVKKTLEEAGVVFADCRYKTRNEYWSEEMAKTAVKKTYKDIGYKDWQIKEKFGD